MRLPICDGGSEDWQSGGSLNVCLFVGAGISPSAPCCSPYRSRFYWTWSVFGIWCLVCAPRRSNLLLFATFHAFLFYFFSHFFCNCCTFPFSARWQLLLSSCCCCFLWLSMKIAATVSWQFDGKKTPSNCCAVMAQNLPLATCHLPPATAPQKSFKVPFPGKL